MAVGIIINIVLYNLNIVNFLFYFSNVNVNVNVNSNGRSQHDVQ